MYIWGRLVLHDVLDLLHDFICQFRQQIQSLLMSECKTRSTNLDVHRDLLRLAGASDDGGNIGILQAPRQTQRCNRASNLVSDLDKLLNFLDLGLSSVRLELLTESFHERIILDSKTGVLRNAVVVLSGQEAGSKRRPDRSSVLVELVKRVVFLLESFASEKIVLRLVSDRGNQVALGRDVVSVLHVSSMST